MHREVAAAGKTRTAQAVLFNFRFATRLTTMSFRIKATAWHSFASACVALAASWLVFGVWYPSPLGKLAGGSSLFLLLMGVDLILGPLLTLIVANPSKQSRELARDLGVILAIQVSALAFGVHAVASARPAILAFEIDVFRVVSANEVEQEQLAMAPISVRNLSWSGPTTLAAVRPTSEQEQYETIHLAIAGIPLAALPRYWRNYDDHAGLAWDRASPIAKILNQQPNLKQEIDKIAYRAQVDPTLLRVLPLLARRAEGMVLLAPGGRVAGMLAATAPP